MIPKKYRATRIDIEETAKNGFVYDRPCLYAKVSKKDMEKACFAIVISKKVEKLSVGRHLIKRRISNVIEKNLSKIKPEFKKAVIFFAKKQEKTPKFSKIKEDVEAVLLSIIK